MIELMFSIAIICKLDLAKDLPREVRLECVDKVYKCIERIKTPDKVEGCFKKFYKDLDHE